MLAIRHLTRQDKRAISLYFAIVFLAAVGLAFGMLMTSDLDFSRRVESDSSSHQGTRTVTHPRQ